MKTCLRHIHLSVLNPVLPIEKLLSLVLSWSVIMRQHLIMQMSACGRLKTKENFKILALKVAAVAYELWSLIRGPKYINST